MKRLRTLTPRLQSVRSRIARVNPTAAPTWRSGKTTNERGYTYRWQKARASFLAQHPLCQCPLCDEGRIRVTPAEVVDHWVPHQGDQARFWDTSNWRAMAKRCHDSWKQQQERGTW